MSSQGPNYVANASDLGSGWTNVADATGPADSVNADLNLPGHNNDVLRVSMGANAFSLPPLSTPTSVLVEILCEGNDGFGGTITFTKVQLNVGGTPVGFDAAGGSPNTGSLAYSSFTIDVNGSLSLADANSSSLGVDIAFSDSGGGPGLVAVDTVRLTITYALVDAPYVGVLRRRRRKMGYEITHNKADQPLVFKMILSSDHVSPGTGLTPTVTIRKEGGSFGSPAGAVTEIANGWYQVAGNATDSDTLGPLVLYATEATCDPWDDVFEVTAEDKQDAVRGGRTALPNANAEAAGGLFTRGTGAGQINQPANGQIDANMVDVVAAALAKFFTVDSGETYGSSVAGSVVKEITDNALTGLGVPTHFSSLAIDVNGYIQLGGIRGTDLSETIAGQLAAAFKKFFDVSAPAYTLNNINDAYTRIGAGGVNLTNLGDTRLAFLDAAVSSRLAAVSYTSPLDAAGVAAAVWNAVSASYVVAGSTGKKLADAAAAGDPWGTALPGAYTAGEAGYIVGNFLTADLNALLTNGTYGLAALEALLASGTFGLSALHDLITGLNDTSAADVWAAATRTLTAVDKTGYKLASDGLDSVDDAAPTTVPANFREQLTMLYRRFFNKTAYNKSTGMCVCYADDGSTVITTQIWTDDGTLATEGAAT